MLDYIGKYKILKLLGGGGFGEVYLGHDEVIQRDVAIKIFKPKDENLVAFSTSGSEEGINVLRARFLKEAQILASLSDVEQIVNIIDYGQLDDLSPYYVMAFVPQALSSELGKDVFDTASRVDLKDNQQPKALSFERALLVFEQVLQGMAEAHKHGLVHRDIKPSNILLNEKGQVRIADFGIAKSPDGQHSTVSHLGIGSRNYMAPEQRESAKYVDARADVYALGVLAYRMFTGKLPTGRYADPNVTAPAMNSALNTLILAALAENKDRRPKDAAELLAQFTEAKQQLGEVDISETATFTDVSDNRSQSVIPQQLRPLATLIEETLIEHGNLDSIHAEMRAMAKVLKADDQTLNALINEVKSSSSNYQAVMPLYDVITEAATGLSNVKDSDLTPLVAAAELVGKDKAWVQARLEAAVAKSQSSAQVKAKPNTNTGKQKQPTKEPRTNQQANQNESTSGYKPVWVAAFVLILAVGSYMGWTTLNPVSPDDRTAGTSSSRTEAQPAMRSTLASLTTGSNILQITSEPSGAQVLLNGVELGATPIERQDLTPGSYELSLQSPYHEQYTAQVNIEAGLVFKENYVLQAANGNLTVTSEPSGAQIRINGQASNEVTPASLTGLEAGVYEIELRRDGYQAATLRDVEVLPDSTARASGRLNKVWRLTVNTEPANARVRLPDIGPAYSAGMELPPGDYRVEVSAPSYISQAFTLSLTSDQRRSVELEIDIDIPLPEMVTIPAGRFQMGGNEYGDEKPIHPVTIPRAFALSKTEITFAQYDAYAEDTGANKPSDQGWGRGNRPVINVSWDDAQAYIGWLNEKTGGNYRLPTEAEWEYGVRAGTTTKYSWGNDASHEYANYGSDECCSGLAQGRDEWVNTSPVGSFPANAFGLQDMHGNVYEWVQDCWNESYEGAPNNGSAWMQGNCDRAVLRGGSWDSFPNAMRSAYRNRNDRASRGIINGFRIAQDL